MRDATFTVAYIPTVNATEEIPTKMPRGMLAQQLPQLAGITRQHLKKQKRRIEQIQVENSIGSFQAAAAIDVEIQAHEKKKKRKKRGKKKAKRQHAAAERLRLRTEEGGSTRQQLSGHSDAFGMQQSLDQQFVKEETPTLTAQFLVDSSTQTTETTTECNKDPLHSREDLIEHEIAPSLQPHTAREPDSSWDLQRFPSSPTVLAPSIVQAVTQAASQGKIDKAIELLQAMRHDSRERHPLSSKPTKKVEEHEYLQESLGLTAEERRTELQKGSYTQHQAVGRGQVSGIEGG